MPVPTVAELVASNLDNLAKVRLLKFEEPFLRALATGMAEANGSPMASTDHLNGKPELVEALIDIKKQRKKKALLHAKTQAERIEQLEQLEEPVEPDPPTPAPSRPATPPPRPETPAPQEEPQEEPPQGLPQVFHGQDPDNNRQFQIFANNEIHIMCFNSLKLRTQREGLAAHWVAFTKELVKYDCVVMQEVTVDASDRGKTSVRATSFCDMLNCFERVDEKTWSFVQSEEDAQHEVHVVFYASPLKVRYTKTWTDMRGVKFAHSPFTAILQDEECRLGEKTEIALTSVHMSPKTSKIRDAEIKAFFEAYPSESRRDLSVPFTHHGASDARRARVIHAVCGDFNCVPGQRPEHCLSSADWSPPLLEKHWATSVGGRAYDNIVISHDSGRCYQFAPAVRQLLIMQNSSKGEVGISDHHPISLSIRRPPLTKSESKKAEKQADEADKDDEATQDDETKEAVREFVTGTIDKVVETLSAETGNDGSDGSEGVLV